MKKLIFSSLIFPILLTAFISMVHARSEVDEPTCHISGTINSVTFKDTETKQGTVTLPRYDMQVLINNASYVSGDNYFSCESLYPIGQIKTLRIRPEELTPGKNIRVNDKMNDKIEGNVYRTYFESYILNEVESACSPSCSNGLVCTQFPDQENPVCAVYPPTNNYSCPEGFVTQLQDPISEGEPFVVKCLTQEEANTKRCPAPPSICPGELIKEGKNEKGCDKIKCILSNGRKAEIKIMPETASQKAIERLGQLEFNVTLKKVGKDDETKVVYELKAKKETKIFGFIKTQADISAEVNAETETGEVLKVKKPWWSFLASGI